MVLTLLVLTLWIIITIACAYFAYTKGKNHREKKELTLEEKRFLERERRELENFWTYNGDSQK